MHVSGGKWPLMHHAACIVGWHVLAPCGEYACMCVLVCIWQECVCGACAVLRCTAAAGCTALSCTKHAPSMHAYTPLNHFGSPAQAVHAVACCIPQST